MSSSKKIYIFDTSTFLDNSKSLFDFGTSDIVIPLKVLEEIDNHKKRQDSVGANARDIIRTLDSLREKGSLAKGVRIQKGLGLVKIVTYDKYYDSHLGNLDSNVPDNEIIGTAAMVKEQNPDNTVILVTRDINLRVKCDSLDINCQDYKKDKIVKTSSEIYTGFETFVVSDELVAESYKKDVEIPEELSKTLFPNQFVRLVSELDEKRSSVLIWNSKLNKLKTLDEYHGGVSKIKPRNKEQQAAFNILLDENIDLVTMIGTAGTGKSLISLAAALELLEKSGSKYNKIIVSRPVVPMGKDIGFLPGTMEEKMSPWLGPIYDNLECILNTKDPVKKGKGKTLDYYFDTGIIEIEALTFIRGRSIPNAIIIIDEAQQLSGHEMKTILTRAGEGSKLIVSGDIFQQDNPFVDETSNGLTYAIEKMKHLEYTAHISLRKGERSRLATSAADLL